MDSINDLFKVGRQPKTEKEMIRAYVKVIALEACEDKYNEVMQCFQKSWFPDCHEQQTGFWDCYKKHTIDLRKKHGVYY
ncbi:uncharacterized protein LOC116603929 [Nematostella vectensis]|uniref:uncharacterized protein LOC116603929 n=1 Tax=Nematostella vectensis TaxID=45351 RepID=UPI00138FDEF1|nr:uncharacterized protein LOC116603929 [Nematostella vectensis]